MTNRKGRPGAVRKTDTKKPVTRGSGGNNRKGLEARKPTPKAVDRVYHKAYAQAQRAEKAKQASLARKKIVAPEYVLGRNPVAECLQAKTPATALYVMQGAQSDERLQLAVQLAAHRGIAILELPRHDLDRMVDNVQHQGVALQVPPFQYCEPLDILDRAQGMQSQGLTPLVVALDNVTDPRNLGAVIRSATAFGCAGVIIPSRRSAGVTAVTWRTSAGTAAHIPIAKATNLTRTLHDFAYHGFTIVGLEVENATPINDFVADTPTLIVVGSEGKGLSRLVKENCDLLVTIPMHPHAESLNASVAASIALYECARQHSLR